MKSYLLIAFMLAGTAQAQTLPEAFVPPTVQENIWDNFTPPPIQETQPMCSPAGAFCVPPMGDCCSGICTGYYDDDGNAINGTCG